MNTSSKQIHRISVFGLLAALVLTAVLPVKPVLAASLTITPDAWNIIGLDSNTPALGPYRFPVGARLHNTSLSTIIATVNFYWDDDPAQIHTFWSDAGANAYINLRTGSQKTLTISIPANGYADAFFEVEVSVDEKFMDPTARPEHRCRILGYSGY